MPHECTNCGRTFDDGSKQMLSGCPDCGGNKFQFRPAGRESGDDDDAASTADSGAASTTDSGTESRADSEASGADDGSASPSPDEPSSPAPDAPSVDSSEAADATADATDAAETVDAVDGEDHAQRDARSSAATPDEIDDARGRTAPETADEPAADDQPAAANEPATGGESAAESTAGRTRGTPQGPPTETPSGAEADEFVLSGAVGPDDGEPVEKQPVAGSAPEAETADGGADDDADLKSLRDELNDQFESIKITEPGRYELNLMELYDRQEYIISLQEDGRYVIEMAENYGDDDR